jgi:hypothetical protein
MAKTSATKAPVERSMIRSATLRDGRIVVRAKYDSDLYLDIRTVPGRRYDGNGTWSFPARVMARVIAVYEQHLGDVSALACVAAEIAAPTPPVERDLRRAESISISGLRARGWTPALIRDLLGEPDRRAQNPHYKSGSPMQLYLVGRVEDAEASDQFAVAKARAERRKPKALYPRGVRK